MTIQVQYRVEQVDGNIDAALRSVELQPRTPTFHVRLIDADKLQSQNEQELPIRGLTHAPTD